ncbi:hypothetical protein ACEPAF_8801 [Sanghuangporus sanghuang]
MDTFPPSVCRRFSCYPFAKPNSHTALDERRTKSIKLDAAKLICGDAEGHRAIERTIYHDQGSSEGEFAEGEHIGYPEEDRERDVVFQRFIPRSSRNRLITIHMSESSAAGRGGDDDEDIEDMPVANVIYLNMLN